MVPGGRLDLHERGVTVEGDGTILDSTISSRGFPVTVTEPPMMLRSSPRDALDVDLRAAGLDPDARASRGTRISIRLAAMLASFSVSTKTFMPLSGPVT